jgi:hypothetical protein
MASAENYAANRSAVQHNASCELLCITSKLQLQLMAESA